MKRTIKSTSVYMIHWWRFLPTAYGRVEHVHVTPVGRISELLDGGDVVFSIILAKVGRALLGMLVHLSYAIKN